MKDTGDCTVVSTLRQIDPLNSIIAEADRNVVDLCAMLEIELGRVSKKHRYQNLRKPDQNAKFLV